MALVRRSGPFAVSFGFLLAVTPPPCSGQDARPWESREPSDESAPKNRDYCLILIFSVFGLPSRNHLEVVFLHFVVLFGSCGSPGALFRQSVASESICSVCSVGFRFLSFFCRLETPQGPHRTLKSSQKRCTVVKFQGFAKM